MVAARALRWSECESLFKKLHARNLHPVLVGGQAVNFWADYLSAAGPGFGAPIASKDIDVLGGADLAEECANALEGRCKRINGREAAVNFTAVLMADVAGGSAQIDFQNGSEPNSAEELERDALEIQLAWGAVRVMHPLHCLRSRVHNVLKIYCPDGRKKYDNPHGLKQLLTSIDVMGAFSRYLLGKRDPRVVLRNYEEVFKFARSKLGTGIWESKHINVFSCVVPWIGLPEKFYEKRYPEMRSILSDRY